MKAAVLNSIPGHLEIEEVEIGSPGPREVLITTKAAGLCHSDLHFMEGKYPYPCPAVLGHESAGVVEAVGSMVSYVQPGDHVITCLSAFCGHCSQCTDGHLSLCENKATELVRGAGEAPRITRNGGETVNQFLHLSSFAEQMLIHEQALVKIDKDMPLDKAALIGCGVTTGVGAVTTTAKVEPGSNVIVFGLGGIGLNVIQGLRMIGARQIVGVDLNTDKKAIAEKFGMTDFVNPKDHGDKLVDYLVELTGGGADYSFECIGNVEVMRAALECCHKGWGESVIIGVAGAGKEISTRPFQLVTGRVWRGSAFGGARGRTDVPKIVDMYMDGRIDIDSLITHTMPLEDINKAFDLMHKGESIRSVVEF